MSLLSDWEIKEEVHKNNMIDPFIPETISGVDHLSYGLSAASYEVRILPKYKLFISDHDLVVDPLDFDERCCLNLEGPEITIPPNGFILCLTLENFNLPDDISILCVGKSSLARCGIVVNPTAIEAGMKGRVVLELSNTSPCPVKIRSGNNGIAKFLFFRSGKCANPYDGNYQNQADIILPTTRRRGVQSAE